MQNCPSLQKSLRKGKVFNELNQGMREIFLSKTKMQRSNGKYGYIFIKLKKNSVQSQKGDKPDKVAQARKLGFMGG